MQYASESIELRLGACSRSELSTMLAAECCQSETGVKVQGRLLDTCLRLCRMRLGSHGCTVAGCIPALLRRLLLWSATIPGDRVHG